MNVAECNKEWKVSSQKYWYWYGQYFIAKLLVLALRIVFTSVVNIPGLMSSHAQKQTKFVNLSTEYSVM